MSVVNKAWKRASACWCLFIPGMLILEKVVRRFSQLIQRIQSPSVEAWSDLCFLKYQYFLSLLRKFWQIFKLPSESFHRYFNAYIVKLQTPVTFCKRTPYAAYLRYLQFTCKTGQFTCVYAKKTSSGHTRFACGHRQTWLVGVNLPSITGIIRRVNSRARCRLAHVQFLGGFTRYLEAVNQTIAVIFACKAW